MFLQTQCEIRRLTDVQRFVSAPENVDEMHSATTMSSSVAWTQGPLTSLGELAETPFDSLPLVARSGHSPRLQGLP
jgi:hypothetical protein